MSRISIEQGEWRRRSSNLGKTRNNNADVHEKKLSGSMHFADSAGKWLPSLWILIILVKSDPYGYDDYSSILTRIEGLQGRFPDCLRIYDALTIWPDLANVCTCFHLG